MFFPPNFAPDTWITFDGLDVLVQEAILDIVDDLEQEISRRQLPPDSFVKREEEVTVPTGSFLVFLEAVFDKATSRARVIGLGVVLR